MIILNVRDKETKQFLGDAVVRLDQTNPDTYIVLDFQFCEPVTLLYGLSQFELCFLISVTEYIITETTFSVIKIGVH